MTVTPFSVRLWHNDRGISVGELLAVLRTLPPDAIMMLGDDVGYPLTSVLRYTRKRNALIPDGVYLV